METKNQIKCGVVMLPTKSEVIYKKCLWLSGIGKQLNFSYAGYSEHKIEGVNKQYLYITSDDEIKDGDWYFSIKSRTIGQNVGDDCKEWWDAVRNGKESARWFKKIIASTDPSLGLLTISDSFVKKYVEMYNLCTPINEVMVEYEYNKLYPMVENNNLKPKITNGC